MLVGILIGLGRMSSDGEIIAMRAAGVSSRKVIAPVLLFALLGMGLAAWASLRLTPYAYRESARIVSDLMANRLSADIQPHVFIEDFENTILYVDNVKSAQPGRAGALGASVHCRCHQARRPQERHHREGRRAA